MVFTSKTLYCHSASLRPAVSKSFPANSYGKLAGGEGGGGGRLTIVLCHLDTSCCINRSKGANTRREMLKRHVTGTQSHVHTQENVAGTCPLKSSTHEGMSVTFPFPLSCVWTCCDILSLQDVPSCVSFSCSRVHVSCSHVFAPGISRGRRHQRLPTQAKISNVSQKIRV